jgi:hypothetical protein
MRVHTGLDQADACLPIPLASFGEFFGSGRNGDWVYQCASGRSAQ